VAEANAADRPQTTPAPRRPVALHRRRQIAAALFRHHHHPRGGRALELRHRQRARAEDRIRGARATGLRNLPLHGTAQNQIWLETVQLALYLLAWIPTLALTGRARLWELRRLRLRLFSAAAQLVTTARRRQLQFATHWPWTDVIERLHALPNPG
jgi:hypothetical protein